MANHPELKVKIGGILRLWLRMTSPMKYKGIRISIVLMPFLLGESVSLILNDAVWCDDTRESNPRQWGTP
jgi:hypothetical protein